MACLVASPLLNNLNKMASKPKPIVMEIPNEKAKKKSTNLQDAFEKFRKGRQREIKMARVMEERALSQRQDKAKMEMLRTKFLDGIKKYFGVPYAKRYHDTDSPHHNAPLFLDCCGLIRKVLLDLKEDFGFTTGGGNQAYQYDTLPIDIKEEDMKPGDLVFISATYYKKPGKKWKKQRHDMVHVEIWAGDGEKTIGARWQKGVVQVFDSYKFVSKSYYDMKFHFKSIDTWLMGISKSFCPEHRWRSSKYDPGRKSIFSEEDEEDDCQAAEEEQEDDHVQQQQNEKLKESLSKKQERFNSIEGDNKQRQQEQQYNETTKEKVDDKAEICNISKERGEIQQRQQQEDQQNMKMNKNVIKNEASSHTVSKTEKEQLLQIGILKKNVSKNEKSFIETSENEEAQGTEEVEKLANIGKISKETVTTIIETVQKRQATLVGETGEQVQTENELQTEIFHENEKSNCKCPECSPTYPRCIHTSSDDNDEENTLNEFGESGLSKSKEITTSLECFEVIATPECRQEVEGSISSCPVEKNEQNGSNGGSPSNDDKPTKDSNGSPSKNNHGNKKNKDSPPKPVRDGARSRMRQVVRQPTFYVSSGNGSSMIEATLISLGWRKIEDRYDETFKLKWVECKSQIDYKNFREGDQLVNHISNIGLLTTKLGLLCSLEEYERVLDKVGSKQRIQLSEFVPETIKLTNLTEKQKFVNEIYKEGDVWICKPIGQNQGKGIYMVNSTEQLRDKLRLNVDPNAATNGRRNSHVRPPQGRIIQRYITNPLLLNSFKFDVRAYMYIASTNPYIVLYHPGYIRLSCVPYSPFSEEAANSILTAHLTNQFIQKKHPLYSSMKDETVWTYERLQSYIDEHHTKDKGLAANWMFSTFTRRMQQIMLTCFHSVRKKLHRRTGFFDLLGFDFMIDENFKVWLIEVNVNPSLSTSCQVLKEVIPDMVDSTVKIALEIFEKTKKRRPVLPLENLNGFSVLYNGEGKS